MAPAQRGIPRRAPGALGERASPSPLRNRRVAVSGGCVVGGVLTVEYSTLPVLTKSAEVYISEVKLKADSCTVLQYP